MDRTHILIPGVLPPGVRRKPFSDAVRAGDTLYISGRLGLDRQTHRPPAEAADEARLVLDDLAGVLAHAGLSMDDLVMVTIFASDISLFETFNAVYLTYFDGDLPARAFVGSGPLLFGARFELTAIATTAS